MRPEIAHDSAMFMLKEIQPMLDRIWASNDLDFNRVFLTSIRDRLHKICVHFEEYGGAEDFEEIYLPLFDALSLLTDALRKKPVDRKGVRSTMVRLERLADLLAATKV